MQFSYKNGRKLDTDYSLLTETHQNLSKEWKYNLKDDFHGGFQNCVILA